MQKKQIVRTRFAPSPTGFIHLGALRTALYAYIFAKKHGGSFILRIEDTDRTRYVEGATEMIYDVLKTCGLFWDEGPTGVNDNREVGDYAPYIQSKRMDLYKKYADELVGKGHAYHSDGAIWQKIPKDGETSFDDEIYGRITVQNSEIEEQVLIKSDGMPTYNFANVIDDHTMNITHIIRGNEFLSSTPKYILLYEAFGWTAPAFIHAAPIMRDSSRKLSKRDGDAYFGDFIKKGYITDAVINYIALLGWSPKGENEIFSLEQLIKEFDLGGISKSPAIFDEVKMKAINAHYIREMPLEAFKKAAKPYLPKADIDYDVLCEALQPRTEVLTDILPQVDFIKQTCDYDTDLYGNKKMKTTPESAVIALDEALRIIDTTEFNKDSLYDAFKEAADKNGKKPGHYLYPLQVALTGKQTAPGGGLDILLIFGKDESVKRIKTALDKLKIFR